MKTSTPSKTSLYKVSHFNKPLRTGVVQLTGHNTSIYRSVVSELVRYIELISF